MVKEDFERKLLRSQLDQKGKLRLGRVFGSYAWILVIPVKVHPVRDKKTEYWSTKGKISDLNGLATMKND
jgi:hypothetical protein